MAEKKTKKTAKKIAPRMKKVARLQRTKKKIAKKRTTWRRLSRQRAEEEVWRFACIAASTSQSAKVAIKHADDVLAAFQERFPIDD